MLVLAIYCMSLLIVGLDTTSRSEEALANLVRSSLSAVDDRNVDSARIGRARPKRSGKREADGLSIPESQLLW
jgi:hypothetical protein